MNPLIGESKHLLTGVRVIGPITDPAVYRSDNAKRGDPAFIMGRSSLMQFKWCPKRWVDGYEDDETKSTEWGDLVDCLFLTPGQFKDRYAVSPANYPSEGMKCPSCGSVTSAKSCRKCGTERVKVIIEKPWDKNSAYCAGWEDNQAPKKCIKHTLFGTACDAVKVLDANPEVKALREASQSQVMALASYFDEETGIRVPLKILIDLLPAVDSEWGKSLVDYKTAYSAAMRPWVKACFEHHYDAQAALYLDVWTANTGEDRIEFRHIVQESYSPYQTEKRIMTAEFLEIGRMKYQAALSKYCACLESGIWPGYAANREFGGWQATEPEPYMVQ